MKNIFISSTFRDMQAERDMVQERVLPALRDEARKYGDNVGVIDLRWGVDTSTLETEEGAAKVLKVCLDEIDRSHPYMLIFIGERYGWIPEGKLIERAVRGREDKYVTEDYAKSVTALEIEYGALSEKYGELDHCVVCFREPVEPLLDEQEMLVYVEQTQEGRAKLTALKERIRKDLGEEGRLITYSGTWDESVRQLVDFTSDGQPLEHVLTNCFVEMFRDDWKEYESLSWQDKEQLAFRALMESKLRSFVGREALLEEYYQSAANGTCPIILQGEVGSGKTAIMCKLVERLQKEGKNVFAFFAGAGSMSTNAEALVKQMVYYMENFLGVEAHFGEKEEEKTGTDDVTEKLLRAGEKRVQYDDWMEQLEALCYRLPEGEKVYFCIDALDQLFPDEHVEKLDFFTKSKNAQVIASCTDEFELPMEAMVKREVKQIPALSEEDAKAVAEGILASYSRNAYAAMEDEILKKKSIGNPLYISLLIQRLNMMDTEELRQAMTEEEIVALGTGIIREMPEETEEAMVAVIRNGIDKISEAEEVLYEVLEYLAVSRNGLRMSDLQGIFAAKERVLPVLDLTLLMKYLDSFFYVHEDDRIDFTHKVIRQGLLKGLSDREAIEEDIKEHVKTLDVFDGLRLREGMYYARIRRDEDFANKLIGLAYSSEKEELIRAIKNEVVADEGKFFCRLIEGEMEEDSVVCEFFLNWMPEKMGFDKGEIQAKFAIRASLVAFLKKIYEKYGSAGALHDLVFGYRYMGKAFEDMGESWNALSYYEMSKQYAETLYEKVGSEECLQVLADSYGYIGRAFQELGQTEDAISYYEKNMKCAESLYVKFGNEESLCVLINAYRGMGRIVSEIDPNRALQYLEKVLRYDEQRYDSLMDESSLRILSSSCKNIGHVFFDLRRVEDALEYYKRAHKYDTRLYEMSGSEVCLEEMAISYTNVGSALTLHKRWEEALQCYEKAMLYNRELYEKSGSNRSLYSLAITYGCIGEILKKTEQFENALVHFQKSLTYREKLYSRLKSERNLKGLWITYSEIGGILTVLARESEALQYYKRMLECMEEYCKVYKKDDVLREISKWYGYVGGLSCKVGRKEEALAYYLKNLELDKKEYEKSANDESLQALSFDCSIIGSILRDLRRYDEALSYYEKEIKYEELIYLKSGSEELLKDVLSQYYYLVEMMEQSGNTGHTMEYYKKIMRMHEFLYEKSGNIDDLLGAAIIGNDIGNILYNKGELTEALLYYKKVLGYAEYLYERKGDEQALFVLAYSYLFTGRTLYDLEKYDEALVCHEKELRGRIELYRLCPNETNLECLSNAYNNCGRILYVLDRHTEAYELYTEALELCKSVCERDDGILNTRFYVKILKGIYLCLNKLGQGAEATEYLSLAQEEAKKLYERSGAEKDMMLMEELFRY